MKRLFVCLLALCVLLSSAFCETLTLEKAKELALKSNRTIEVAALTLQSATRSAGVNKLYPSISLNAKLGATFNGTFVDGSYAYSYGATVPAAEADVSFSYSTTQLLDGDEGKLKKKSADLTYESSVSTVLNNVTTAYWNAVSSKIALRTASSGEESAKRNYEQALERYDDGLVPMLTVQQAEINLQDYEIEMMNAESTYLGALDTLSYLIGDGEYEIPDELPEVGEVKGLDEILAMIPSSVSYRQSENSVDSAILNEKSLKLSSVYPTLTLSGAVGVSATGAVNGTKDSDADYSFTAVVPTASISAVVSVPMDHFFKNSSASAELDNAKTDILSKQVQLEAVKEELENSVRSSYRSLETARKNIEKQEKHVELSKAQLETTKDSYEGGRATYETLLDAETTLYNSEISLLQSHLNYISSLSSLANTLSVGTEELTN